ncbi:SURF1 family protein [Streptomyces sp. V3I7]|uniref:SURF1 family cytochrome oxidase biogenesis protein n=1 Tax=Streptomyces sp. V3I7 TaxID=3042278 RepID=UPI00278A9B9C|nr:SURF1 family protein [Streptomyces sp. V3I7]MDQ0990143.1 cytochrome oxidase assembly protein ShyY1 [Streptomyces sp. V3I7]
MHPTTELYRRGVHRFRFLLTRQWVILTLVAIALIPTMILLGFWQQHRYETRTARNQLVSDALHAKPVPVERLTSPGHAVTSAEKYHTVTATGTFDTAREVVVRRRVNVDDKVGFHVLTPLVLTDGKVLLVNRGWIPATGAQTAFPKVPAPPAGRTTITGRLMADETTAASGIKNVRGLPDRQIMLINSEEQARRLATPVLGGYVEQTAPQPKGSTPEQISDPGSEDAPLNYAYMIQWWLFAACVPVGWWFLVRRELRDRAEAALTEQATPETEPATA